MYARGDGGKFFMPATGISNEGTNGVPGIQQMIDHSLPAFTLAGVPNNVGAMVTRVTHGVDIEASVRIMATIDYVEGKHTENGGFPDMTRYYNSNVSAAAQTYLRSLNFNIEHMHITPFMSPQNATQWERIQPCCNGDGDGSDCVAWCPHTGDGLCCDPGVPPIDPNLEVRCIMIDFVGPDNDSNALRMGRPRQSLGWNQGTNVGTVNSGGFLERRFTNHGGGIIFNLPLGEAKLGNYDQLRFTLRTSNQSGAELNSPIGVTFTQNRELFPGSGNWWDGNALTAIRMERPWAGLNVLGTYTFDLTTPYNGADGKPLPRDQMGLTNFARWQTGNVSLAIGRNVHTSTMEFGYIWLRAIGCDCDHCSATIEVIALDEDGEESPGGTVEIVGGTRLLKGTEATAIAVPFTASGFKFLGWFDGDNLVSEDPVYTFIVGEDKLFTAVFHKHSFVFAVGEGNVPFSLCELCDDVSYLIDMKLNARVQQLNGNTNDLYITVTETYSCGYINVIDLGKINIRNNSEGIYDINYYKIFVDTKGNTQIRALYITNGITTWTEPVPEEPVEEETGPKE